MSRAITIPLAINVLLGVGWIARMHHPTAPAWTIAFDHDFVRLVAPRAFDATEMPRPFTPTLVAIRAEDNELNLHVYGSLEHPESWRPHGPPVVYVYPAADVTVGDVVAALDRLQELAPANTVIVTELR